MKKLDKNKAAIIQAALDKNYWGKRLKDKRLECAENLIQSLELNGLEPLDLACWLDANKPEKQATSKPARAKASKPAANTLGGTTKAEAPAEYMGGHSCYVITAAQNNTAINAVAWQAVKDAAAELGAEILVLPIHYNLSAFSPAVESEKEYFDPALAEHLMQCPDFSLFDGAIKVSTSLRSIPTDKLPINGLAQLNTGELFTLAGHTKQQLRTLPRLLDQPIRQAITTGTVTGYNYTATRAGATAQADHAYGFVVVQFDACGVVTATAIRIADDGSYAFVIPNFVQDGAEFPNWTAYGKPTQSGDRPAVVLGDLHCEMKDPAIFDQTLALLEQVDPALVVCHDVIHFGTLSHHNRHDSIHLYRTKDQSVFEDLAEVIRQLNELAGLTDLLYLVESNHNSAVDRWIGDRSFDPSSSPHNAAIYHLISWLVCQEIDEGGKRFPWEIALQSAELSGLPTLAGNVIFGRMDQPYVVYGFDLSQHGHKGNNGSQGSHAQLSQFSKQGMSLICGHTHSPAITGRCYTVGVTASLNQGYNRGGGSSWANGHALLWPNGEAHLVGLNFQTY